MSTRAPSSCHPRRGDCCVFGIGLDPYLGVYHRPRFGRPALALDLMEEFRPLLADSIAVALLNHRELTAAGFLIRSTGVALTDEGRRAVLRAYERRLDTEIRHPMFGYTITYRRVLEVQARLLAAHLLGEVPAYVPFSTRCADARPSPVPDLLRHSRP